MEKFILATLKWRLRPFTAHYFIKHYLLFYLQKYKNLDHINTTATAILEQFPRDIFFRCMEVIDLAVLDYNSLKFLPSKISATVLYLLERDAPSPTLLQDLDKQLKAITGYDISDLTETIQWIQSFITIPVMAVADRMAQLMQSSAPEAKLHPTDILSIQSHNPNTLSFFENILLRQNG